MTSVSFIHNLALFLSLVQSSSVSISFYFCFPYLLSLYFAAIFFFTFGEEKQRNKKTKQQVTRGHNIVADGWAPDLENEIPGDFQEISRRFQIFPGDNFRFEDFNFSLIIDKIQHKRKL